MERGASRIVVTGMGIISAVGMDLAENLVGLRSGKSGIATLGVFPSRYAGTLPCAEVPQTTAALFEKARITEPGTTRTTALATLAFQQAVEDAALSPQDLQSSQTALISATTVGGMCLTDELYRDAHQTAGGSPYLATYDTASCAMYLQRRYGLQGILSTINTACSSSANAIGYGARLLLHGRANRAIVGGVDSLSKFTLNGFNSLHILSKNPCRPFDQHRDGLNLGEGAAFLVLEKQPESTGKKIYARLSGYGNANDAFHPSSLSENGEGPYLAMLEALASAGLTAPQIDFVNAHGTGTENNDLAESRAMIRLFDRVPPFGSTKAQTGHTLGAAGALEAVFSICSLLHQEIYPNLNFQDPIPETGLQPQAKVESGPVRHVMSNSFGFGGNCTSLIFSNL